MAKRTASEEYPHLFRTAVWGAIKCGFEQRDAPPPVDMISNVNLVPFVGKQVLMLRLQDGTWEIPGGTCEPAESYLDTLCRELLEEAGARLLTFSLFAAWHCYSSAVEPYRPHLPHPEFYRVVGWGKVELVGEPRNPRGGEHVVSVACVPVEEAQRRFRDAERPDLAELYCLAYAIYMAEI